MYVKYPPPFLHLPTRPATSIEHAGSHQDAPPPPLASSLFLPFSLILVRSFILHARTHTYTIRVRKNARACIRLDGIWQILLELLICVAFFRQKMHFTVNLGFIVINRNVTSHPNDPFSGRRPRSTRLLVFC